jgi:hypothetical protein
MTPLPGWTISPNPPNEGASPPLGDPAERGADAGRPVPPPLPADPGALQADAAVTVPRAATTPMNRRLPSPFARACAASRPNMSLMCLSSEWVRDDASGSSFQRGVHRVSALDVAGAAPCRPSSRGTTRWPEERRRSAPPSPCRPTGLRSIGGSTGSPAGVPPSRRAPAGTRCASRSRSSSQSHFSLSGFPPPSGVR